MIKLLLCVGEFPPGTLQLIYPGIHRNLLHVENGLFYFLFPAIEFRRRDTGRAIHDKVTKPRPVCRVQLKGKRKVEQQTKKNGQLSNIFLHNQYALHTFFGV